MTDVSKPEVEERLEARSAALNNEPGSKPNVSRMTPTIKETTISLRATIAGDPPTKRPTTLLLVTDDLDWRIASATEGCGYPRGPRFRTFDCRRTSSVTSLETARPTAT